MPKNCCTLFMITVPELKKQLSALNLEALHKPSVKQEHNVIFFIVYIRPSGIPSLFCISNAIHLILRIVSSL